MDNIQQNLVTLPGLEVHTKYCVQVQIITRNPNPSESSRAVCESTAGSKQVISIGCLEITAQDVVEQVFQSSRDSGPSVQHLDPE